MVDEKFRFDFALNPLYGQLHEKPGFHCIFRSTCQHTTVLWSSVYFPPNVYTVHHRSSHASVYSRRPCFHNLFRFPLWCIFLPLLIEDSTADLVILPSLGHQETAHFGVNLLLRTPAH
jgi:hypothetical protein